MTFQPDLDFDAAAEAEVDGDALVVDLDGYEGPLHVLLALARSQKVDLLKISITRLAEQYLSFMHDARKRRFALAADYLVMASWLAYLKSRLLLPKPGPRLAGEPPAEEMAAQLAYRLMKLEAMRRAVDDLKGRPQLKRDVFTRGDPDALVIVPSGRIDASLYDLMQAYVTQRSRATNRQYSPGQRLESYPLEEARARLKRLMPDLAAWTTLDRVAPLRHGDVGPSQASYIASTLAAGLELTREGALELRQLDHRQDIYLRRRDLGQPLELTS